MLAQHPILILQVFGTLKNYLGNHIGIGIVEEEQRKKKTVSLCTPYILFRGYCVPHRGLELAQYPVVKFLDI